MDTAFSFYEKAVSFESM